MEEWIGDRWHRIVTRLADTTHAKAAVSLASVVRPASLLFRAAGGAPGVRVVAAAQTRIGGARRWLQRLAGSGERAAVSQLDGHTLALPPVIAVFDDAALNRDLYLWLATLAGAHDGDIAWIAGNQAARARVFERCPGLSQAWVRLRDAHLAQRPLINSLPAQQRAAETEIRAALLDTGLDGMSRIGPLDAAPVWLWLEALPSPLQHDNAANPLTPGAQSSQQANPSAARRRARQARQDSGRAPLVLPSRVESITTWAQHLSLDRPEDDADDGHASAAADDMDTLTLARDGAACASRVKFDLDLPSAGADDLPLGPGETLPEWDWKRQRLLESHCRVLTLVAASPALHVPSPSLSATARRVRRRLEVARAAPCWQRGQPDGEELDVDAWVRHVACSTHLRSDPPVFARRTRGERSLATLLLADLSLSTDAHVSDDARVIDVIRDALHVFGEALHGAGDPFAMLGFSSVRRANVRIHQLKGFDETWGPLQRARVGAIRPGYYTRMGAAIRLATRRLSDRPERQRLLLILTDGKPNDIDVYEGRWGIEDTRHAVQEARAAGLLAYCLSIDEQAHDYLPHLFGPRGWSLVRRPAELPSRLAAVYARLTRG